ncbi:TetR/AcrR family transcriptional regulator [Paenibacillus sp. GXUN7292]|uniref:TetR/AcrR family transcriptional regulator n=1 Tax=Paenibacillus sp. GXUN7292 TaxID=3422499 RepID=UPI003D7DC098
MNKRKKVVVDHALALFIEKGIQQSSIQDIIERAGISKGTFYNYFSSKNDCVGAILELIRYEASISRSELLIGKDKKDLSVLVQQIATISILNASRNLSAIFEEIFHSGDIELKKLVLTFRLFEMEWLADRLVDVFGEELRPHALEAATIFYGIHHHITFTGRIIDQTDLNLLKVSHTVFHYMKHIIQSLVNEKTALLDNKKLALLRTKLRFNRIDKQEIILLIDELRSSAQLTKPQADLTSAMQAELKHEPVRDAVLTALLQPLINAFQGSDLIDQAREITSLTWMYLKQ